MEINYIGESLAFGKYGNAFVALAFTSALVFSISYLMSLKGDKSWKKIGRVSFIIHALSVFGVIGLLLYLINGHFFEYYYVWFHSSLEMPARYIFSCFWEGQEGSFLLWSFWHVILCSFIILKSRKWEAPVLSVMGMIQVFLSSMILGIYVFGEKIGSNPFILLREHPDMLNLPFTQSANYLEGLNGRGLNPLLQNYWMIIHPPVLFLGFASTAIPFAFVLGGLFTNKVTEWVKPALPYAFFGVMILGTGILMGGAWAYEALSFGGFWAWDPVENASLVPLITFIGAAHVLLIFKRTGRTLITALILTVITFVLILYSTFLTRSGILGDTSVHAFTDLGMSGHLLIYMLFFTVLPAIFIFLRWNSIPKDRSEDKISSREFWMFIGVLTLIISALQITFVTSIPVWNKLFGLDLAPPADVIDHYNSWQIPIAIIVCLLIGLTQFLKYKSTNSDYVKKHVWISLLLSIVISGLSFIWLDFDRIQYYILMFASVYAIVGNLDYFIRIIKAKVNYSGASVAHMGVGFI
ncbi:MAG: cytochrome c biogenesis protein CcsA, partial [Bacteroidia bacterium]|nr:cytochrome c biogenesis protein CcsA [Bacteroidia bacterium]